MTTNLQQKMDLVDVGAAAADWEWAAENGGRLGGRWFPMRFVRGNDAQCLYEWTAETEHAWEKHVRPRTGCSIAEYFKRAGPELDTIVPRPAIFIFFSRDMTCSGHVARVRKVWRNAQIYHYSVHGKSGSQVKKPGVYHGTGAIHVASKYIVKKMAEESPLFQDIWKDLKGLSSDQCGFYLAREPDRTWMESIRSMEDRLFDEYRDTRYLRLAGMNVGNPTPRENKLFRLAGRFVLENVPELAVVVLESIQEECEGHCNAWTDQLDILLGEHKAERAYETVKRGMAKYPDARVFDWFGARCCMEMQWWGMAEQHLKRLWGQNPWDLRTMLLYAQCLHFLGENELASKLFLECRDHRSLWFGDESLLGLALSRSGRHAESLAVYEKMVKVFAENPVLHNNVAMELASVGRYEEALKRCNIALKLSPKSDCAWDTAGFIHLKRREYDEAEAALLKSTELNPDYTWAWRQLLHVYHDSGQAEKLAKTEARVGYYLPDMLKLFHREKGTDIRE